MTCCPRRPCKCAGIGFAGISRQHSGRRLLLACGSGRPCRRTSTWAQRSDHLEVSPAFWARNAKRAQATGEALVILHSHPRETGTPKFSFSDDRGEAQLIPKIRARAPVPVAAVVVAPGGEQARITWPADGTEQMIIRLIGRRQGIAAVNPRRERFDRQLQALGEQGRPPLPSWPSVSPGPEAWACT